MNNIRNYNYKKKNLPHSKKIINPKENFHLFISQRELISTNIKIRASKFLRFFRIRKYSKVFEKFVEENINKLSDEEVIQKLRKIYIHSEIVLLSDYKAMKIIKSINFAISIEKILEILKNLKNNIQYYAYYGLGIESTSKRFEFIDLQDFNFSFSTEEDIRFCVQVLQNLDSEGYKFSPKSSLFILRNGFLDTLKNEKYIKYREEEYVYLDVEDFTFWNKFPTNYPDKTEEILQVYKE